MAKQNSRDFIKLFRSLREWEWWGDSKTVMVFIYCLLTANWKDTTYRYTTIPRGSFVTTLNEMAAANRLSIQNVRTALKHLISTGEITRSKIGRKLMVTVSNYDDFQTANTKVTRKQHESNSEKQVPTIISVTKNKEVREAGFAPSLNEVVVYVNELNSKTNPDKFFNYYEGHGWPFDWKAKLREWTAQDGTYDTEDKQNRKWEC